MVLLSHSIIIACSWFTIIKKNTIGAKPIAGTFGFFNRSSASAQFMIHEEEEEVATKVGVCNPRLVSL